MALTIARVLTDLKRLVKDLAENDLAVDYRFPQQIRDGPNSLIGWGKLPSKHPYWSSNPNRVSSYIRQVKERQYTCVLSDGSLLQLTYEFTWNSLTRHRLCYFPCPVVILEGELQPADDLIEIVELLLEDGLPKQGNGNNEDEERLALRTPVRFDFDSVAARAGHPSSHCTLNGSGCRIPVFGPLSIGDFVSFVFKHFYPELWGSNECLRTWTPEHHSRTITATEDFELHFERRVRMVERPPARLRPRK